MAAPVLPMLGALALIPAVGAVSVDETYYLNAEAATGSAPPIPGGERELSLYSEVRPGFLLLTRTRRTTLELVLEPRMYYRYPNIADLHRPLFLMSGGIRHEYALSERVGWLSLADAQYGEIEYSSAHRVLDSPLARPTTPVIVTFDANAQTGFRWAATRRYSLSMAAVGEYTASGDPNDEADFPTTTIVGGDITHAFELDQKSTLSFPATGRYYFVSSAPDWTVFTLSAGYRHTPNPRTTLEAEAGVSANKQVGGTTTVFPRMRLTGERVVQQTAAVRVINRLAIVLDATFDPLLGEIYPVVGAELTLTTSFATRWSATVQALGYTAATREPVNEGSLDTYIGGSASVGYALTNEWQLEFGTRTSARAPHFSQKFVLDEGEIWAFVRIRGAVSSRRPDSGAP
jgi:hypothetical protein